MQKNKLMLLASPILRVAVVALNVVFVAQGARVLEERSGYDLWGMRPRHVAVVNPVLGGDPKDVLSLNGEWDFCAHENQAERNASWGTMFAHKADWGKTRKIRVPGHVETQGVGEPGVSEPWDLARALGHNRLQALHVHDNDYIGDNHQVPYVGKIDWKKVCQALGEIDYQGDFTYECGWAFVANIDDEFMPVALKYMSDIGHHLCDLVDRARPKNQ